MRMLSTTALALFAACGSAATGPQSAITPETQIGKEFTLRVGEAIELTGTDLHLEFVGVSGDSRCPLQAECVWAGDGEAVLLATTAGATREDTLHTNIGPQQVVIGSVELTLVRLDPYPETPGSIPSGDYVVTLISKLAS